MKALFRFPLIASLGLLVATSACSSSSSSPAADGGHVEAGTPGDGNGKDAGAADSGSKGDADADAGPSLPSIAITDPSTEGGIPTVKARLDAMNQTVVPIAFSVERFTLAAPGMCGTAAQNMTDDNCGHVHIFVDGSNCTPEGAPYNNDAIASPTEAILSDCPMIDGAHSALLELHHGDHSPIVDPSTGMTVSASVTFTVTGP